MGWKPYTRTKTMEPLLITSLLYPSTRMAHSWFWCQSSEIRAETFRYHRLRCGCIYYILFFVLDSFDTGSNKGDIKCLCLKDLFFYSYSFLYNKFFIYIFFNIVFPLTFAFGDLRTLRPVQIFAHNHVKRKNKQLSGLFWGGVPPK